MIHASSLGKVAGVRHGFFTRKGGVSEGIYTSLNTGLGSADDRTKVKQNRDTICKKLGADALLTPHQVHSPDVVTVIRGWDHDLPDTVPRADGIVTRQTGLAIAVNTADCTPVLFASGDGRVVGAAHAGWKGALSGVLRSTVTAMRAAGAEGIVAAIGPTISQESYEVGPEFRDRFLAAEPGNMRFFEPSERAGHWMFDLPGYVRAQLEELELAGIEDTGVCTYADETRFFSYRRATHRGEPDYGRQLSAIVIGG